MTPASAARTFEVRHVQLARAAFAALAAVMITFSPDHSAAVGLSVFSGFAIATGLVFLVAAWLVFPAARRWPAIALGIVSVVTGMAGGLTPLRTDTGFFAILISWALVSGAIETISGWRDLRPRAERRDIAPGVADTRPPAARGTRSESRDALLIGVLTVILGIALLFVPGFPPLDYSIDDVDQTFTLTGIIIGVGVFGGYCAIVAVFLAIAGFSPRRATDADTADAPGAGVTTDEGRPA